MGRGVVLPIMLLLAVIVILRQIAPAMNSILKISVVGPMPLFSATMVATRLVLDVLAVMALDVPTIKKIVLV